MEGFVERKTPMTTDPEKLAAAAANSSSAIWKVLDGLIRDNNDPVMVSLITNQYLKAMVDEGAIYQIIGQMAEYKRIKDLPPLSDVEFFRKAYSNMDKLWLEIHTRVSLAGREINQRNVLDQAEALRENMFEQRAADGPGVEDMDWIIRLSNLTTIIGGLLREK